MNGTAKLPEVCWVQRMDRVFLTFDVRDCYQSAVKVEVENAYPMEMLEGGEPYVESSEVMFECEFREKRGEEGGEEENVRKKNEVSGTTLLGKENDFKEDDGGVHDGRNEKGTIGEEMEEERVPLVHITPPKAATKTTTKYAASLELYSAILSSSVAKISATGKHVFLVLFKPKPTSH